MTDPEQRKAFVAELHRLKTDIFMRMVESGAMPLRPGVRRLVGACPQGSGLCTQLSLARVLPWRRAEASV